MATPFCEHFGVCGGCSYQDIDYDLQLADKKRHIERAFQESGLTVEVNPVIPSPKTQFYRNRMDFVIWPTKKVGLRKKGKWDDVVDIKRCFLLSEESNGIIDLIRSFIKDNNLTVYDQKTKQGFLRYLVIREAKNPPSGNGIDKMITFVTGEGTLPDLEKILPRIQELGVRSIFHSINTGLADLSTGTPKLVWGKPYLEEQILGKTFCITPNCFFQTNPYQATELFAYVKEKVSEIRPAELLDLYCGVGAFTLVLSDVVKEITGIEIVPDAVDMAKFNAQTNGITNAKFIRGDVERMLKEEKRDWDAILVDPPRGGMSKETRRAIESIRPINIVYVSCNPVSLAQDIAKMGMYEIKSIQPFDLFPHTPHVECVVVLELR